jgi:hypothetical protein
MYEARQNKEKVSRTIQSNHKCFQQFKKGHNTIIVSNSTIQRNPIITALTVTPQQINVLSSKMCWDAVAYCLYLDRLISRRKYNSWGNSQQAALARLVDMHDLMANNPNIPANTIVGIFRNNPYPILSHVMLSLGNGLCIGSNNGCIGGSRQWSVVNIAQQLNWNGNNPPTFGNNPRLVYYRGVATAINRF